MVLYEHTSVPGSDTNAHVVTMKQHVLSESHSVSSSKSSAFNPLRVLLLTCPYGEGLPFVAPGEVVQETPIGLHQLDPLRLALQQPAVAPGFRRGQLVLGLSNLSIDQQVKAVLQTDLQTHGTHQTSH